MWLIQYLNSVNDNSYNEDNNAQWYNLIKDYGKYTLHHKIKNNDDDNICNVVLAWLSSQIIMQKQIFPEHTNILHTALAADVPLPQ